MRIVFFGTSQFAANLLQCLLQHQLDVVAVVTRPDKPQGRSLKIGPPPVKELLEKSYPDIPLFQPVKASTPEFAAHLQALDPDVFIVAAYGEIIKTLLLEMPRLGALNVHGSVLPKYRGAAPIQRCLMHGDAMSGITIMKMVLEMDAGDILEIVKVPLSPDMTFGELEQKLSEISGPALLKVLDQLLKGNLHPVPQDRSQATFAPKITPFETEIKWNRPALEIHNLIRGLSPQPGAWCWVEVGSDKKRLKIKRSHVDSSAHGYPGENLTFTDREWIVGCEEGGLRLLEIQLEGKKSLPILEFLRGHREPLKILT
jgi:methionyl-tRNA formyltransferase